MTATDYIVCCIVGFAVGAMMSIVFQPRQKERKP
jgi:hypothetical protein